MKEIFYRIKDENKFNNLYLLPILSGALFVFLLCGFSTDFFVYIIIVTIGIIDLKTFLIPDILNYTILILGIIFRFSAVNIFVSIYLYLTLWIFVKWEKLGKGDQILLAGIGMYFGEYVFYIIILASLLAFIYQMFSKKEKAPYGYFVSIGTTLYLIISKFYPFALI